MTRDHAIFLEIEGSSIGVDDTGANRIITLEREIFEATLAKQGLTLSSLWEGANPLHLTFPMPYTWYGKELQLDGVYHIIFGSRYNSSNQDKVVLGWSEWANDPVVPRRYEAVMATREKYGI